MAWPFMKKVIILAALAAFLLVLSAVSCSTVCTDSDCMRTCSTDVLLKEYYLDKYVEELLRSTPIAITDTPELMCGPMPETATACFVPAREAIYAEDIDSLGEEMVHAWLWYHIGGHNHSRPEFKSVDRINEKCLSH